MGRNPLKRILPQAKRESISFETRITGEKGETRKEKGRKKKRKRGKGRRTGGRESKRRGRSAWLGGWLYPLGL